MSVEMERPLPGGDEQTSSPVLNSDILGLLGLSEDDVSGTAATADGEPDEEYIRNRVAPEEHSTKKLHEQGWVQAAGVGGVAAVAVGFLTLILSSSFGIGGNGERASESKTKAKTDAQQRGFIEQPSQAEQEKSRIQAESAVRDQRYGMEVEQLRQAQQQQVVPQDQAETAPTNPPKPTAPPEPVAVAPPPPEPVAPPPLQEMPPVDPQEEWQRIQQLWSMQQQMGSFHSGNTRNLTGPGTASVSAEATVGNRSSNLGSDSESVTPTETETETLPQSQPNTGTGNRETQGNLVASNNLLEAQYAFLSGKIYEPVAVEPGPEPLVLRAGTVISGQLSSPVLAIEGDQEMMKRPFVVELEVNQKRAYLLATINQVARNGFMLLEGILLVTDEGEYEIPAGFVEVRGDRGRVLMAQRIDGGLGLRNIMRMTTLATLAGLREAASLYNRTTQETRVTDRETIIVNRTPPPNYSAASVQGFLNDFIQRANQTISTQASRDASREVAAWQIPAGQKVEVFFRRTLTLQ